MRQVPHEVSGFVAVENWEAAIIGPIRPPESTIVPVATAASSVDVQAVPTSRGPNLEATDPSTVSLASGQLHLVEFFRFT